MATLRLTRAFSLVGLAVPLHVYANGVSVGQISNNQTADFTIPAGKVNLQLRWLSYGADSEILTVSGLRTNSIVEMKCFADLPMRAVLELTKR